MISKSYIITGAPGTGKSTLIEALKEKGYFIFEEIARKVIAQEVKKNTDHLPWLNIEAFSILVLEQMLAQKPQLEKYPISFTDRGIPDIIGYLHHAKISPDSIFEEYLKTFNYAEKVFFTPIWEEIYENDTERLETIKQANLISETLFNTYVQLGFDVVIIPKLSVSERLEFILKEISN